MATQRQRSRTRDLQDQRNRLDAERGSLANERYHESLLAPAISNVGLLVAAALPLVPAWYLLMGLRSRGGDDEVREVLRQHMASDGQLLLPWTETTTPVEHDESMNR